MPLVLPLDAAGTAYEGYLTTSVSLPAACCVALTSATHMIYWQARLDDCLSPLLPLQAHRRAAAASARPASLWLRLSGLQPGGLTLRGTRLEVNAELGALLEGREGVLAQRLAESASLPAFFLELQNMVDHASLER